MNFIFLLYLLSSILFVQMDEMVNGSILSCFLSINLSDLRIYAYALLSLVILQPCIF